MKELVFESIDCCEKNEKILWDNWNLQSDLKNTYSYCVNNPASVSMLSGLRKPQIRF